jgi:hypothetical protein
MNSILASDVPTPEKKLLAEDDKDVDYFAEFDDDSSDEEDAGVKDK